VPYPDWVLPFPELGLTCQVAPFRASGSNPESWSSVQSDLALCPGLAHRLVLHR